MAGKYEAVIGLEVHAELQTRSKMFCSCPVVDLTATPPNQAVCPVCSGQPGVLPVVNREAVAFGIKAALALGCSIPETSLFDRKNYFYPDLPKGYQISQYEHPLAVNGQLPILVGGEEKIVRIRRVHLEEDTGKLTHVEQGDQQYSLVDLNRAGVPLLEIVSEPDMRSAEEALAYGKALRDILRYLGVNSGELEKGVIRFEANVSVRPVHHENLGIRTEVKNLNSFKAMERAIAYEIQRQCALLNRGEVIRQQTLGWDDINGVTFAQRGKEDAHDYRYFPEPDLPPLVVEREWIEEIRAEIPELPAQKFRRFTSDYRISIQDAQSLTGDLLTADFFEQTVKTGAGISPQTISNWITGELFAWLNSSGKTIGEIQLTPKKFINLLEMVEKGVINQNTAKMVLAEMLENGDEAEEIVARQDMQQLSEPEIISGMVRKVILENPKEAGQFATGKEALFQWFFGQVMRASGGKANPQVVRLELLRQLKKAR